MDISIITVRSIYMSNINKLSLSPPHIVQNAIAELGGNLRTARLRRNMKMTDAAQRIGVGVRAVRDAENGKMTTAVSVYFALMWLYDLLPDTGGLANPDKDVEGRRLADLRSPRRASTRKEFDNDF
jgi:transcriptional regulator with XRE-family HTH domain